MRRRTTLNDMRCILFYLQQKERQEGPCSPFRGIEANSFYVRPLHALLSDELIVIVGRDEQECVYLTRKGRELDVGKPNLGGYIDEAE